MEKLNKLEQEIYDSFPVSSVNAKEHSIAAAKVCMKWIEKAFDAGKNSDEWDQVFGWIPNYSYEQWIKNEIG